MFRSIRRVVVVIPLVAALLAMSSVSAQARPWWVPKPRPVTTTPKPTPTTPKPTPATTTTTPTPATTTTTPAPVTTSATPTPTPATTTPIPTPTTTTVSPEPTTTSATPTPTDTAPAPSECGGEQVVRSTGEPWVCTFDDEFDGTTLDTSKWVVQTTAASAFTSGAAPAKTCYVNSPNNVAVADGYLQLGVRKEAAPFSCASPTGAFATQFTAGSVMSFGKFSQTYGRVEVRAKFPASTVAGLQETLWLWPDNATKFGTWPLSGEIDFAEIYSLYNDRSIPYVHYIPSVLDMHVTNNYCVIGNLNDFHHYAMEWTPTSIKVMYDGKTCIDDPWLAAAPLTGRQPFDQPFFIALTQALGVGANAYKATTPLPAYTTIDYVRAWQ
jgi:beta-glucanase (GH16 family)